MLRAQRIPRTVPGESGKMRFWEEMDVGVDDWDGHGDVLLSYSVLLPTPSCAAVVGINIGHGRHLSGFIIPTDRQKQCLWMSTLISSS